MPVALFRQMQVIGGMCTLDLPFLSSLTQALPPIFANGLQHLQTWLLPFLPLLREQVLVQQRGDPIQHVSWLAVIQHLRESFHRPWIAAADEDREPPKEPLLLFIEQIITPLNGVTQGLLPLWQILCPTR